MARRAAEAQAQAQLNQANANPGVTGGGTGSVANTAASLAQPPTVPPFTPNSNQTVDLSSFTPNATMAAARIAQGDYSPAEQAGEINLGRNMALGPGQDFATRNAIAQAKAIPYDTTAGVTHHVPGGVLPETTTSGGDAGAIAAQNAQLLSAQKDADAKAELADAATSTQGDLIKAKNIYNSLVGTTDVRSVLSDGMIKWLAGKTGFGVDQLNDPAMAKLAIKRMLKASIGSSLAAVQGDATSPVRGILQQTNDFIPNPDELNDQQFNAGMDQMLKITGRQMEQGGPARIFKTSQHTVPDAAAYYNGLEAIRARQEQQNQIEQQQGAGGGGGEVYIFPDQATAQAAINAGQLHEGDRVRLGGKGGQSFTVGHVGQ